MTNECLTCGSTDINILRRSGYISLAIKQVKQCRCLNCTNNFVTLVTPIELVNDQGLLDVVMHFPSRNRQQAKALYMDIVSSSERQQ